MRYQILFPIGLLLVVGLCVSSAEGQNSGNPNAGNNIPARRSVYIKPIHLAPGQVSPGAPVSSPSWSGGTGSARTVSARTGKNNACSLSVVSYRPVMSLQPVNSERRAPASVSAPSARRGKVATYHSYSSSSQPYYSASYVSPAPRVYPPSPVPSTRTGYSPGSGPVESVGDQNDRLSSLMREAEGGSPESRQGNEDRTRPGDTATVSSKRAPDSSSRVTNAMKRSHYESLFPVASADPTKQAPTKESSRGKESFSAEVGPAVDQHLHSLFSSTPTEPRRPNSSGETQRSAPARSVEPPRASASAGSSSDLPEFNQKVVKFAFSQLGRQVGNGECATLAVQALAKTGAKPAGYYVYGRELRKDEPWFPGDIVQFTTCRFVEHDGNRTITWIVGSPRHTAIVYSVLGGGRVKLLHQHVNQDRHVQMQTLDFSTMVSGTLKVYRPLPPATTSE